MPAKAGTLKTLQKHGAGAAPIIIGGTIVTIAAPVLTKAGEKIAGWISPEKKPAEPPPAPPAATGASPLEIIPNNDAIRGASQAAGEGIAQGFFGPFLNFFRGARAAPPPPSYEQPHAPRGPRILPARGAPCCNVCAQTGGSCGGAGCPVSETGAADEHAHAHAEEEPAAGGVAPPADDDEEPEGWRFVMDLVQQKPHAVNAAKVIMGAGFNPLDPIGTTAWVIEEAEKGPREIRRLRAELQSSEKERKAAAKKLAEQQKQWQRERDAAKANAAKARSDNERRAFQGQIAALTKKIDQLTRTSKSLKILPKPQVQAIAQAPVAPAGSQAFLERLTEALLLRALGPTPAPAAPAPTAQEIAAQAMQEAIEEDEGYDWSLEEAEEAGEMAATGAATGAARSRRRSPGATGWGDVDDDDDPEDIGEDAATIGAVDDDFFDEDGTGAIDDDEEDDDGDGTGAADDDLEDIGAEAATIGAADDEEDDDGDGTGAADEDDDEDFFSDDDDPEDLGRDAATGAIDDDEDDDGDGTGAADEDDDDDDAIGVSGCSTGRCGMSYP
jgi:hypothetical protein